MQTFDITKMSEQELKVLVYDFSKDIGKLQDNIKVLEAEISRRKATNVPVLEEAQKEQLEKEQEKTND